jgi:DNA-binding beta-propeller fold protein YncE
MSNTHRSRTARRASWGVGASVMALAVGGLLAPAASAGTTPPDYTIVDATGSVSVPVDLATGVVGPSAGKASAVAFSPDGKTEYLVQGGLTPVSLSSGAVGASIPVGSGPDAVAISPDGTLAYVANNGPKTVTPVPLPGGPAGTPIAVTTPGNMGVAFAPDGKFAYVVGANAAISASSVTPINVVTGQALPPIPMPNLTLGGIRISTDGKTAYVPSANRAVVDTVDLTTNTLGPQISLGLAFPAAVTLSPDGKTLYVATNIGVVAVNLATGTAAAPIPYPGDFVPADIAITPDGRTLYISQSHRDQNSFTPSELFPIDVATGVGGTPIVTDTNPNAKTGGALAITPDQAPVAKVVAHATCLRVSFDASGSTVRYRSIVQYAWSFGDGHTSVTTTPKTTHTYAHAGTHKVTVTETDSAGTSTRQVFTGQTMTLNGGPSAVASVTTKSDACIAPTVPSPPAGAAHLSTTPTSDDLTSLPRTGAQTRDELLAPGLLLAGGAGLVSVARRRRS